MNENTNKETRPLPDGDLTEALIRAYRPLVYATARRLSPRDPLDEDLLQCGLIGVWEAAEGWDRVRPFGPLARQCVYREMVDYLRRREDRLHPLSLDSLSPDLLEDRAARQFEEDEALRWDIRRVCPPGSRERALLLALSDGENLRYTARRLGLYRNRARRMARRVYKTISS